ncbi:MAG: GMC family oxidoreductase [Deltaproteobacteria bacterium]|nr:GMC family oxidoreductase [Deltaproteobacteria bacterium]
MTGGYHSARDARGDLTLDADVVVVGSGAGGSTAATELASTGLRVLVLEEGPRVLATDLGKMRPTESLRHVWRDGAMLVTVPLGDSPAINVTMGRCVGGSSVVTGGVCFRTPGAVLSRWRDEFGLLEYTPEALEPYFLEVERHLHVEEVPLSLRSRSTALFAEGARALGYELQPMRRNTDGCNGCGRCNFGCPHQAKLSVDLSYLPRAVRAGAEVWSHCLVERVEHRHGRVDGVSGRLLNRPGSRAGARLRVHAPRVVLAAGSWHTPVLLKRSRLGNERHVGRHMTVHPGFRMLGRFDAPVQGWKGALQSAWSDHFEPEGITLTSLFLPTGVLGATVPGAGPEHLQGASKIDHLTVFGGILHDEGGGTVHVVPGREPLVTYRMDPRDRARIPRLLRIMAETFLAAGAEEVFLPVLGARGMDADTFRRFPLEAVPASRLECASQHPLGTARMACSEGLGVTDPNGKVWDLEGLWIADGSIVPTSLGVNPQLSIMALATRVAQRMRG